jgi:3-oxoadipate enol-lactonase
MLDHPLFGGSAMRTVRCEAMKNGTARVNGTTLYYERTGNGFPIVLVSGGGLLDRTAWDNQFEVFSSCYEVIRYDIRGIGKSGRPLTAFSHSEDLHSLLWFLGIEKAHLVGLSFGGAIALDFALDHPEMVDHLVLVSSGTSTDSKAEANLKGIAALSDLAKKEGAGHVARLILESGIFVSKDNLVASEKIRQVYLDNRDVLESGLLLVTLWQPTEPAASERLSEISAPVLILMGENDNPAYKAMTERIAAGIVGSKKMVIAGSGHVINLDKPEQFNQAVIEFLGAK